MNDHTLYSVKAIPGEYKRLFGRDTDIYDVIELLPIVLRACHSVPLEYVFISTKVKDFKVVLPCVYYSVRYAMTPYNDCGCRSISDIINNGQGILVNNELDEWRDSMASVNGDVMHNQVPVQGVTVNKNFPKTPNGTFVDFKNNGNVMTFNNSNFDVEILLTIMPVDKDGFPKVTEEVMTAMAYFLNMVFVQKRYYMGQMPQYIFHDAKRDYEQKLADAITPQTMSENEVNDIMNALSSYQRHSYNTSFKG